jgi:hypothetical protein
VHRRQSRRAEAKQKVLNAMRCGAALCCQHTAHGSRWVLSNGIEVLPEAEFDVRADPHVQGVGDAMFDAELSQTFRYLSEGSDG